MFEMDSHSWRNDDFNKKTRAAISRNKQSIENLEIERNNLEKMKPSPFYLSIKNPVLFGKQWSTLKKQQEQIADKLKQSINALISRLSLLELIIAEIVTSFAILAIAFRLVGARNFTESVPPILNYIWPDAHALLNALLTDTIFIGLLNFYYVYIKGNNYQEEPDKGLIKIISVTSGLFACIVLIGRMVY
ncbi:MAG: hypothetical protein HQL05_15645 [Nitrospirae bacterium]|nr:hypothetical protein [Nitrospirota bacterium]